MCLFLLALRRGVSAFERGETAIETSVLSAARPIRLTFASNFLGSGGLGVYARRLAGALNTGPYAVTRVQEGGGQAASPMPSDVEVAIRHGWDHGGTNSFAHGNFAHNILPEKARNVLVFGFVPTLLSEDRIDQINRHFSLILCDSTWTAQAAHVAGIRPRVVALPPPLWRGEGPAYVLPLQQVPFTFLHVSNGDGFVKGTDLVVTAFVNAFGDSANVRLILKLSGSGADHLKSGRRTRALVNALAAGNVELDTRRLDQQAMRILYSAADCYVHVPRSESLGMPPLEAAACGVPSILHYGGPGHELSKLVPHFLVSHEEISLPAATYRDNRAALAFEASINELADVMVSVADGEMPSGEFIRPYGSSFEEAGCDVIVDHLLSVASANGPR